MTETTENQAISNEVLSVIAAAVAMMAESRNTHFVIKDIKAAATTTMWAAAGRQSLMSGRNLRSSWRW